MWYSIVNLVLVYLVYVATILLILNGIWKSRNLPQVYWLPLFRIVFNHLVLLAFLSKMNTSWPWGISELFYWMADPIQIDCLFTNWPILRHSQIKLIIAALLPPIIFVKSKVGILCVNSRIFKDILEEREDLEKLLRLTALYISLPWIILRLVESFNCRYLIGSESI